MRLLGRAGATTSVVITGLLAGCSAGSGTSSSSPATPVAEIGSSAPAAAAMPKFTVVAAENFWGSIAAQLGGDRVAVNSVIKNPDTDPHDYEATPADARSIAGAQLFIQNGIGYDTSWAPKLVEANPNSGRDVLTVGEVVGLTDGDNPHQWYSADSVHKMIDAITAEYSKIEPADASYFAAQHDNFVNTALARYSALESEITAKYAGTPIGASESIVSPLADSLGLKMLTPYSFLRDISEGTDPTVADKSLIDSQIQNHQIKVYVYNTQNSTPDVAAQLAAAKAAGIPVSQVTETLAPAEASFQDWMVGELEALEAALAAAVGPAATTAPTHS
ncbi:MAG TPA: zinc ABC transporter substrate-binding protein [Sporichthyaceae bacterium]|nr:zinc ABC transporter substrate-binding protein [Sporichthyaceae bacterium]